MSLVCSLGAKSHVDRGVRVQPDHHHPALCQAEVHLLGDGVTEGSRISGSVTKYYSHGFHIQSDQQAFIPLASLATF